MYRIQSQFITSISFYFIESYKFHSWKWKLSWFSFFFSYIIFIIHSLVIWLRSVESLYSSKKRYTLQRIRLSDRQQSLNLLKEIRDKIFRFYCLFFVLLMQDKVRTSWDILFIWSWYTHTECSDGTNLW